MMARAKLAPVAWASLRSARVRLAEPNITPLASVERSRADVRLALEKLAPVIAESLRSALVRSAPANTEAWNLASRRMAPTRVAPEKLAPMIRAPERLRPDSSHFTQEPPKETCREISLSPACAAPAIEAIAKTAADAARRWFRRVISSGCPCGVSLQS